VIQGWHVTNKRADSFLVTEYARSEAAKLRSSARVGTIVATFSAAWAKDSDKPKDEPPDDLPGERSGDATGKGPPVEVNLEEVQRHIGVVRDTIAVRYTREPK
jgi:hypothetical protein